MSLFRLFVDSSTGIDIDPEYDFKDGGKKIEDVHRTKAGVQYRYLWGEYTEIKFSLMYVSSADQCTINSYWGGNQDLLFMEVGNEASLKSVHITNKKKPIDGRIKPYADQYKGTVILETYL